MKTEPILAQIFYKGERAPPPKEKKKEDVGKTWAELPLYVIETRTWSQASLAERS